MRMGSETQRKGPAMRNLLKIATLLAMGLFCASFASAQRVYFGVGVGPGYYGPVNPPPVCNYGYYNYYPYACAPYGYYGPQWFVNGVFIGVGPWYHGYWRHPGYGPEFYGRGYYGRGFYGGSFAGRGWDHDGFRGLGFAHEGPGRGGFDRGGGFHGGEGHGGGHGGRR